MPGHDELHRMANDEDIVAEAEALAGVTVSTHAEGDDTRGTPSLFETTNTPGTRPLVSNPLNWRPNTGGHTFNSVTRELLSEAGGVSGVLKFTTLFYESVFLDSHLDAFIRDRTEKHAERFAFWIREKFGDLSEPWTVERSQRSTCHFASHGHNFETPHDRSSAHFAAWHSPKRTPQEFGRHFKLDDCRVWMRVHFWSLRDAGITKISPSFTEYYVKFIAHFMSVYERQAPQFARESFRWSENEANVKKYLENGRHMDDVIGLSDRDAIRQLPASDNARGTDWPYV